MNESSDFQPNERVNSFVPADFLVSVVLVEVLRRRPTNWLIRGLEVVEHALERECHALVGNILLSGYLIHSLG